MSKSNNKDDDDSTLQTIITYVDDIETAENKIKVLKEQLAEIIEKDAKFDEVDTLSISLAKAKEDLKLSLMSKREYNDLCEKIAQLKEDLKENKDILSDYLVEFYATKHERQLQVDPSNGNARDIILKGKLGKEQKKYQTNLFNGNDR